MRERWRIWQLSLQARILKAFFAMVVTLAVTIWMAKLVAGDQGLDLLRIQLNNAGAVSIALSPWMVGLLVVWLFVIWWFVWPKNTAWEAKEVTIDVAKIGSIKLAPNQEVAGLAHRAWSEIVTRKACLPFDERDDVITEVYDSWYALFAEIRALIKAIPVEKLRASEDARKLCDFLKAALNDILRPHLTKYQARFRAWFDVESEKHKDKSPQDIQKTYPEYIELVADLKSTISEFTTLEKALKTIARGNE